MIINKKPHGLRHLLILPEKAIFRVLAEFYKLELGLNSKEAALSPIGVELTMGFTAGGEIAFDVVSILLFLGLFSCC